MSTFFSSLTTTISAPSPASTAQSNKTTPPTSIINHSHSINPTSCQAMFQGMSILEGSNNNNNATPQSVTITRKIDSTSSSTSSTSFESANSISKSASSSSDGFASSMPLKKVTSGTSYNDSNSDQGSSVSGKVDSLLTSEVSSSSINQNGVFNSKNDDLDDDVELIEDKNSSNSSSPKTLNKTRKAHHHAHAGYAPKNSTVKHCGDSSSDDDENMQDAKEACSAPCHHKCKIGVQCNRHGAKILAKLKRKAEKQAQQQRLQEHALKKQQQYHHSLNHQNGQNNQTSQNGQNNQNHQNTNITSSSNSSTNQHAYHHQQQLSSYNPHLSALKSGPGKPPPIKSVVPPSVPKNQQNGHEALKELMFIDTCNSLPGTRKQSFFKRYKLYSVIGIGGGGTVYAGRRVEDNTPIAVKRVMRTKVKRWEKTRDGRTVPQEIALMIRSNGHIGVCGLFDWFETVDSFLLVLERPESSIDLFDYIRECGPLSEDVSRHIILHVINGIQHLYNCGIVHRDIKDENVVLDRNNGVCKLIDFGCGTNFKEGVYTEFSGTAEFYPPEWFSQRRYWAMSATIWSLGVLLFDMLQGEIPFKNSDRILENRPLFKEPISPGARNLVRWMLSNDHRKRPSLIQILEHSWMKEYIQGKGMSGVSNF